MKYGELQALCISAPSRIRTCGLLLRREALYRRGNLVPTRKSLQIGSFAKGHEKSRRSTSYQLLFPLCSHLRGVRCDGSLFCARRDATANALPAAGAIRRRRPAPTQTWIKRGRPRTPPSTDAGATWGPSQPRGLLLLVRSRSVRRTMRGARYRAKRTRRIRPVARFDVSQIEVVLRGRAVVANLPGSGDRLAIVAEGARVALREVQRLARRGVRATKSAFVRGRSVVFVVRDPGFTG